MNLKLNSQLNEVHVSHFLFLDVFSIPIETSIKKTFLEEFMGLDKPFPSYGPH
jgi:hypothetical protein